MTLFDIVVLIIVGISCVIGLWRGFVREVISVASWIAALLVAKVYSPAVAPLFEGLTENETGRYVLAFAILCFITLLLGAFVGHVLTRLISIVGLLWTDRLLGAAFGVARGLIIAAIIVYFAAGFYSQEAWWQASQTIPWIEDLIERSRLFLANYGAEI